MNESPNAGYHMAARSGRLWRRRVLHQLSSQSPGHIASESGPRNSCLAGACSIDSVRVNRFWFLFSHVPLSLAFQRHDEFGSPRVGRMSEVFHKMHENISFNSIKGRVQRPFEWNSLFLELVVSCTCFSLVVWLNVRSVVVVCSADICSYLFWTIFGRTINLSSPPKCNHFGLRFQCATLYRQLHIFRSTYPRFYKDLQISIVDGQIMTFLLKPFEFFQKFLKEEEETLQVCCIPLHAQHKLMYMFCRRVVFCSPRCVYSCVWLWASKLFFLLVGK